jgi:hypothetical protein
MLQNQSVISMVTRAGYPAPNAHTSEKRTIRRTALSPVAIKDGYGIAIIAQPVASYPSTEKRTT